MGGAGGGAGVGCVKSAHTNYIKFTCVIHYFIYFVFMHTLIDFKYIYNYLSYFNKNKGFKSAHAKYNKFTCILFYFILSYLNKNKCFRSICVFDKYLHMHFIALFYVNFIHFNNFKHWLKGQQSNILKCTLTSVFLFITLFPF